MSARSCALARGVQTFPVAPACPEVQICLPPHNQDARRRRSQQTRLTWHCSCGEPLRSRQPSVLITALCGGVLHAGGTRPTVPDPGLCAPLQPNAGFSAAVLSWPVCVRHQWGRRWTAVPESRCWGLSCFWPVLLCLADGRLLLPPGLGVQVSGPHRPGCPVVWPRPGVSLNY